VNDLLKSHKEMSSEIQELKATVKLISIAVKPLLDSIQGKENKSQGEDFKEVLDALRQVLEDAEKTLKDMNAEKQKKTIISFILNPFKNQNHIEHIKGYQEKLKTLTPILNLAMNSIQHHSRSKEEAHKSNTFDASNLISNEKAKPFWLQHFGNLEYKVSWSRFASAIEHEIQHKTQDQDFHLQRHLKMLKKRLDAKGDDEVDIYEYDSFTKTKDLLESFMELVKQEDNSQISTKKRKLENITNIMNIPLKRQNTERSVICAEGQKETSKLGYSITLIGQQHVLDCDCAELSDITCLRKEEPFIIGRALFTKFPEDLLLRVSRQHCSISGTSSNPGFELQDLSGNGTYLNGNLVGKTNKILLEDGDRISILMSKPELVETELGFIFKLVEK